MPWQPLLASKRVQPHTASLDELAGLRAVVARDLRDAALSGLSADRRFAIAYNTVLQAATMVIACAGYRVRSGGHHHITFVPLELAMGPEVAELASYFDTCRRKRNLVDYNMASVATETEIQELVEKAQAFRQRVEDWIAHDHPEFLPPSG
jgi:hypothetical protein